MVNSLIYRNSSSSFFIFSFIIEITYAWFFLCVHVVSLFSFLTFGRQGFNLSSLFWQPCQSHKSNGVICKSVAIAPNQNGVQLFTHLFLTPRRDLSLQQ